MKAECWERLESDGWFLGQFGVYWSFPTATQFYCLDRQTACWWASLQCLAHFNSFPELTVLPGTMLNWQPHRLEDTSPTAKLNEKKSLLPSHPQCGANFKVQEPGGGDSVWNWQASLHLLQAKPFFISAPRYLVLPMRSQDFQSMALIQFAQGRPRQAVAMAASAAPPLLSLPPFLFLRKKTMYWFYWRHQFLHSSPRLSFLVGEWGF